MEGTEFTSVEHHESFSTQNNFYDNNSDIFTWDDEYPDQSLRRQSPKSHGKSNYMNNMSDRKWDRSKSKNSDISENCDEEMRDLENQIETSKQVLKLMRDSGFTMTQVNGQRKLGPPPGWTGPPPDPECEVFVGKIPRDLYEHEIFPIFRNIGDIYEIRLMMDFSGTNRGYCFVMYTKVEYANRAISELNNYEIRPGRKIGVVPSINNCRLSVGQLPLDLDTETFIRKICETTTDLGKVAVYRYTDGRIKNALISYKTHIAAAMGRRRLVPARTNLFPGVEITVDWAHPKLFPYNVMEESGIVDENGHVEIVKTYINSNKKPSRSTSREEFLNESITSYIEDEEEESSRYRSHDAMSNDLKNWRKNFTGRRKCRRSNNSLSSIGGRGRSSSECNLQFRNDTQKLSIAPPKKIVNSKKESSNTRKLRDINGNMKMYKSSLELSRNVPIKIRNPHNKFLHEEFGYENKENIPYKYKNVSYLDKKCPITYQQSCMTNCSNCIKIGARGQFSNVPEYESKNLSPEFLSYFNRCSNLNSVPSVHENHLIQSEPFGMMSEFNPNQNCVSVSSMNGDNQLMLTQPICMPPRFACPRVEVYEDIPMAMNQSQINFNSESVVLRNFQIKSMCRDQLTKDNYNMRHVNDSSRIQSEPQWHAQSNCVSSDYFNALNNHNQALIENNGVPIHVPKCNTQSFGLGKIKCNSGLILRGGNENYQSIKVPRPILSRNTMINNK